MAYRLVEAEKASPLRHLNQVLPVARMLDLLGVSSSGFYGWRARGEAPPGPRARRRELLAAAVVAAHRDSDGVYGAPRITAELRDQGHRVSRKTVAKVMAGLRIQGISPRPWRVTTQPDPEAAARPDLVGRVFDTGALDRVWISDITYLATDQGWLYLAAIRDACSRRVIGWAIEDHMRAELVTAALDMAVRTRGQRPEKVVFHADRGSQGGFNWSSQHLVMTEVFDGSSAAGSGPGDTTEVEVAWASEVPAPCRVRVLGPDHQGASG